MNIDRDQIVELVKTAGRLVGVQEILKAGGLNPGLQTEVKRALRELVREGRLERDGKRFGVPGLVLTRKSGPAWTGKTPQVQHINRETGTPARTASERAPELMRRHVAAPAPAASARKPAREPTGPVIEGTINHHPDGFAFVRPVGGAKGEDIFIPPDEARKALDHDQVVVEVIQERDGRSSGRVLEVKARTRQMVVGTYVERGDSAWVQPREAELELIRVPKTQLARPGDAVKVRLGVGTQLLRAGQGLTGEVAGSLGSPDDFSVEVLSVAYSRGFQDEFPPEVMDEADGIALKVSAEDAAGEHRRDLRSMPLVTIDGEDARDFDDAIWVDPTAVGWRLVVAIADVSHYVQEGSALDTEALRRATSVYLPGRVLPMLPERLSNGICSLKPDEDRLCMVADMEIDRSGATLKSEIYPAVMRSNARCTYTEVHQVLGGQDVPSRNHLKPLFEQANTLAKTLTGMRRARGSIDFDLPETRVELNEDGLPKQMVRRDRWESHKLVEECMLAANEAVARFFRERDLPTVNRYHGEPDEGKLGIFMGLLNTYGFNLAGDAITSRALNEVLQKLEGHPEQRALHQLALRSMMQAVYTSLNAGHYGLGAEDYLHFTSPIRRYPDLLVHRLLKQFWRHGAEKTEAGVEALAEKLELLAVQSSERERAAMQVEREVNSLYACLLVKDRVGEEFPATVCGLSENGFFVELDGIFVEGLVKGETVFADFEFDQATYRMNFGNGQVVRVGHKARVVLTNVNLTRKQLDFECAQLEDKKGELVAVERLMSRKERGGRRGGGKPERPGRDGGFQPPRLGGAKGRSAGQAEQGSGAATPRFGDEKRFGGGEGRGGFKQGGGERGGPPEGGGRREGGFRPRFGGEKSFDGPKRFVAKDGGDDRFGDRGAPPVSGDRGEGGFKPRFGGEKKFDGPKRFVAKDAGGDRGEGGFKPRFGGENKFGGPKRFVAKDGGGGRFGERGATPEGGERGEAGAKLRFGGEKKFGGPKRFGGKSPEGGGRASRDERAGGGRDRGRGGFGGDARGSSSPERSGPPGARGFDGGPRGEGGAAPEREGGGFSPRGRLDKLWTERAPKSEGGRFGRSEKPAFGQKPKGKFGGPKGGKFGGPKGGKFGGPKGGKFGGPKGGKFGGPKGGKGGPPKSGR